MTLSSLRFIVYHLFKELSGSLSEPFVNTSPVSISYAFLSKADAKVSGLFFMAKRSEEKKFFFSKSALNTPFNHTLPTTHRPSILLTLPQSIIPLQRLFRNGFAKVGKNILPAKHTTVFFEEKFAAFPLSLPESNFKKNPS